MNIAKEIDSKAIMASSYSNLGIVNYSKKDYKTAINNYHQSRAIFRELNEKKGEADALNNLGNLYFDTQKYTQAKQVLMDAVDIWDNLRINLEDEEKISIFDTQFNSYQLLQKTLIALNETNTALEISERSRARALVDLLTSKFTDSNIKNIKTPNIEEIKRIAKQQNSTIIQYSIINDANDINSNNIDGINELIYVWVITSSGEITFKQIDLTTTDIPIAELVKISRDSMGVKSRGDTDTDTESPQEATKHLQQLYSLLINPIASYLPNNPDEKVIFIPHQELFLVPFAALQDKEDKYLIEKHTIVTAPSIQVLGLTPQIRQQQQPPSDSLIVGINLIAYKDTPPVGKLYKAEEEALAIAKLTNSQAIIGEEATETLIKQKMSDAGIIHFATHGLLETLRDLDFMKYRIPGAIALQPSPADNEDGLLTANEILELELNAQLVVLSACNTGTGDITGDGVVGLSRSLMEAGVPSILASLWSVPDAPTSELMIKFYQQWQQGQSKAIALRQAMLETMKTHPEPKDWAAFILIGEAE